MTTKALGTLTLDIVARTGGFEQGMDRAQRQSERWRKQVERDLKTIQGGLKTALAAGAAAATAAVAATVALTKSGMDAVNAQADLAKSLDTTYDSISALKLAAGDSGLDGLEGSLTRLNRRLGASEVGAGAAANAVKALNLDLDALSKMDVDERVATIADAIRDSGVSMQRAARLAQDLGFEQREAAAFFMQGGDAIRSYRGEVDALGLSLSDIDAAKVQEASKALGIVGDVTSGVAQRLAVEFSPILLQVASDLKDGAKETGGFSKEISAFVESAVQGVAFVASAIDGVVVATQTAGKALALVFLMIMERAIGFADSVWNGPVEALNGLIEVANKIPGIDIAPRELSETGKNIKSELAVVQGAIAEARADIAEGLMQPLAGEQLIEYYQKAKSAAQEAAESAVELREGMSGGVVEDLEALKAREAAAKAAAAAEKARLEGIEKEMSAIARAAKIWGMSADEVKLYDLKVQGATEAQIKHAQSLLETVSGLEKAKKEQEAYLQLVKDLRTDEEKLTDQFHERIAVLDAMADSARIAGDEYAAMASRAAAAAFAEPPKFAGLAPKVGGPWGELDKVDKAEAELESWYASQLKMLEDFRAERADLGEQWDEQEAELAQQHQDRLAEIERARQRAQLAAGEDFFGNMADAAKVFFGENSRLYQAAFAMEKAYAVGKALMNVPKSYSDAFAAVVGIPIVGPALAPAAGVAAAAAQVAQAAAIGNINMTGMAHDGIDSVPKTGTWLLEKGERVTTAQTSARLDAVLDSIAQGRAANDEQGGRRMARDIHQHYHVQGALDRRTANQASMDLARRQRLAESRFGR